MRVVIKVGTSTVAHPTGQLNIRRMEVFCKTLADLKNAGHEIILVSSGAIGMGVGRLHLGARPEDLPSKQAAAAVGQCEMMYTYDRLFSKYGHTVGQVLLTAEDIRHATRRHNVEATLFRLIELGALPVVNENDTVATEEIEAGVIGENDTLSAEVAVMAGADLLILLTDMPGLFTADPRTDKSARLIPLVTAVTEEMLAAAGGAGTGFATGGMRTKLLAAQLLEKEGIDMVITGGQNPEGLYDVVAGLPVGTKFAFGADRQNLASLRKPKK